MNMRVWFGVWMLFLVAFNGFMVGVNLLSDDHWLAAISALGVLVSASVPIDLMRRRP